MRVQWYIPLEKDFQKKKGEKKGRRKEIFPHPILDQTLSNVLKQSNNYN